MFGNEELAFTQFLLTPVDFYWSETASLTRVPCFKSVIQTSVDCLAIVCEYFVGTYILSTVSVTANFGKKFGITMKKILSHAAAVVGVPVSFPWNL